MSDLALSAQTTLPEESAWFQRRPNVSPDIEEMDSAFRTIIHQGLKSGRDDDASDTQSKSQTGPLTVSRPKFADTNLDKIVRRTFPHALGAPELSLQPLQEWEGYVTEIGDDTFSARLVDRTAGRTIEDEVADFPITDLSDEDRNLLVVGGVFRWVIGYQRSRAGSKRRVSQVTFRRMPSWSRIELKRAAAAAERFVETVIWD